MRGREQTAPGLDGTLSPAEHAALLDLARGPFRPGRQGWGNDPRRSHGVRTLRALVDGGLAEAGRQVGCSRLAQTGKRSRQQPGSGRKGGETFEDVGVVRVTAAGLAALSLAARRPEQPAGPRPASRTGQENG